MNVFNIQIDREYLIVAGTVLALIVIYFTLRSKPNQRSSDARKVGRQDKETFKQALKIAKSDPLQSARMLESIRFFREAIQVLEDSGQYRQAAQILYRMGRPNRAGILLRRRQLWKDASLAFEKASMPREAGECAKKSGDVHRAVKFFSMVGDQAELAECYLALGNHASAAKAFLATGNPERALQLYPVILQTTPNISDTSFSDAEIKLVKEAIISGRADLSLAKMLTTGNEMVATISTLSRNGDVQRASKLYLGCTIDLGPALLGERDLNRQESLNLAKVFNSVSNYEFAGKVFERIEEFMSAGEAFGRAEMFERAAYCYDRGGNKQKATEMRIALASRGEGRSESKGGKKSTVNPASRESKDEAQKKTEKQPHDSSSPFVFSLESDTGFQEPINQSSTTPSHYPQIPKVLHAAKPVNRPIGENASEFGLDEPTNVIAPDSKVEDQLKNAQKNSDQDLIVRSDLLKGFEPAQISSLIAAGTIQTYKLGEIAYDHQSHPPCILIILEGGLRAQLPNVKPSLANHLEQGNSLGLLTVLTGRSQPGQFIAYKPTRCFKISKAAVDELVSKSPEIAQQLYKSLTDMLLDEQLNQANTLKSLKAASF